jgi:hypothetical protein
VPLVGCLRGGWEFGTRACLCVFCLNFEVAVGGTFCLRFCVCSLEPVAMNTDNFLCDRPSTRVRAPPGGSSSISFTWSEPAPVPAAAKPRAEVPVAAASSAPVTVEPTYPSKPAATGETVRVNQRLTHAFSFAFVVLCCRNRFVQPLRVRQQSKRW